MTIGKRIKRIRRFRGLTQKQLGALIGFGENGEVRIAQYESDARIPGASVRQRLAEALGVSLRVFSLSVSVNRRDFMQSIFWMEDTEGEGDIYGCIKEWEAMKTKWKNGEISEEEYIEWKLTYDDNPSSVFTG